MLLGGIYTDLLPTSGSPDGRAHHACPRVAVDRDRPAPGTRGGLRGDDRRGADGPAGRGRGAVGLDEGRLSRPGLPASTPVHQGGCDPCRTSGRENTGTVVRWTTGDAHHPAQVDSPRKDRA
ncbi:hypothetical protein NKG05_06740 [Oerskovia sp. M15]